MVQVPVPYVHLGGTEASGRGAAAQGLSARGLAETYVELLGTVDERSVGAAVLSLHIVFGEPLLREAHQAHGQSLLIAAGGSIILLLGEF